VQPNVSIVDGDESNQITESLFTSSSEEDDSDDSDSDSDSENLLRMEASVRLR